MIMIKTFQIAPILIDCTDDVTLDILGVIPEYWDPGEHYYIVVSPYPANPQF